MGEGRRRGGIREEIEEKSNEGINRNFVYVSQEEKW